MIYMLKNKSVISLLLIIMITSGCGYRQTNTQIRDVAFLKFNKSMFKDYTVIVNDKYKFTLDGCTETNNPEECNDNTDDKLFEITSGNVVVKVLDKENNMIMKKEMYIGSSNTKEINLP